jgi:hypothetical protein
MQNPHDVGLIIFRYYFTDKRSRNKERGKLNRSKNATHNNVYIEAVERSYHIIVN